MEYLILICSNAISIFLTVRAIRQQERRTRRAEHEIKNALNRIVVNGAVRALLMTAQPPPDNSHSYGFVRYEATKIKPPLIGIWQAIHLDDNYRALLTRLTLHGYQYAHIDNVKSKLFEALNTEHKITESELYLIHQSKKRIVYVTVQYGWTDSTELAAATNLVEINLIRNIYKKVQP